MAEPNQFTDFNSYEGNYVILTSDRLILNSKADSVFVTSNKTIGFSAVDQIHFNVGVSGNQNASKNYLIINSPLIQLGLSDNYKGIKNEPVAKAESTIEFINVVIDALINFCNSISSAKGVGAGVVSLLEINTSANILRTQLQQLTEPYKNVKNSKIVSKTTKVI